MRDRDYDYADDTAPSLYIQPPQSSQTFAAPHTLRSYSASVGRVYVCAHCAAEVEEVEA